MPIFRGPRFKAHTRPILGRHGLARRLYSGRENAAHAASWRPIYNPLIYPAAMGQNGHNFQYFPGIFCIFSFLKGNFWVFEFFWVKICGSENFSVHVWKSLASGKICLKVARFFGNFWKSLDFSQFFRLFYRVGVAERWISVNPPVAQHTWLQSPLHRVFLCRRCSV